MQIVDHEEIVFEETVEEEGINDRKPFNPESTGSLVLIDSVKQGTQDSLHQVMSSTALKNLLASTRNSMDRSSLTSFKPSLADLA